MISRQVMWFAHERDSLYHEFEIISFFSAALIMRIRSTNLPSCGAIKPASSSQISDHDISYRQRSGKPLNIVSRDCTYTARPNNAAGIDTIRMLHLSPSVMNIWVSSYAYYLLCFIQKDRLFV